MLGLKLFLTWVSYQQLHWTVQYVESLHRINSLTPMSDQDIIFHYNINTISIRQMVRIRKNINLGIISWFNSKFFELTL